MRKERWTIEKEGQAESPKQCSSYVLARHAKAWDHSSLPSPSPHRRVGPAASVVAQETATHRPARRGGHCGAGIGRAGSAAGEGEAVMTTR